MEVSLEDIKRERERRASDRDIASEYKRRGREMPNQQLAQHDWISKVAYSAPIQMINSYGDYLSNAMSKGAHGILDPASRLAFGQNLPTAQPIITGQGPSYNFMQKVAGPITGIGAGLMTGNPSLATASLGGMGIGAAMTPEDPIGGALRGGSFGTAGKIGGDLISSALSKGLAGAQSLGRKIGGEDITENFYKNIAKNYEQQKDEAWNIVKPIFDKYGKGVKLKPQEAMEINTLIKSDKRYLSAPIKKVLEDFNQKPTIDNMQRLQSVIGKETRKLDLSQTENQGAQVVRDSWRDSVIDKMLDKMEYVQPGSKELYQSFRPEYAKNVGPYDSSKTISEVAEGLIFGKSPTKVYEDIMKGIESGDIAQEHYLARVAPSLKEHIDKMSLYENIPLAKKYSNLMSNEQMTKILEAAQKSAINKGRKTSQATSYGAYGSIEGNE